MNYLEGLNPPQRDAVLYGDGPLLVLAGAGSGKTRVITSRIARLIKERGVDPGNILAVTFTNKAANEMKLRLERMLGMSLGRGVGYGGLWISTFHSACVRILRSHIDRLGYKKTFVIFDESDRSALIKACAADLKIDTERYQPKMIGAKISSLKNSLLDVEKYAKAGRIGFEDAVGQVYELYAQRMRESDGVDFDDLLMLTVRLFELHHDVLGYYQNLFQHILIDEYQDTNHAQYRLVRQLTMRHKNLCVVGDDDQSIYKFRGADISNILNFERDYPNTKVIKLEQNYRSTSNILGAAGAVVSHNVGRKPKELWTEKRKGDRIRCYKAADEKDEARFICKTIQQELNDGRSCRDIAVLYRTNAQSRAVEDALRGWGLPYRIFGGLRFYDRKEIKDIIAYLRVLQNPLDIVSLARIINVPARGIGDTTIERLKEAAASSGTSLYDAALNADASELSSAPKKKLKEFTSMMERLRTEMPHCTLTELVRKVIQDSGYGRALEQEKNIEARIRLENLNELLTATEDYQEQYKDASLAGFLDQVALISDAEQKTAGDAHGVQPDSITLMTLHNAKGLEFAVVFMVGMEEGLFPHARSAESDEELEEERRLCYVGITRAKERLIMTHAYERRLYGYPQANMISRFVRDIPEEMIDMVGQGIAPTGSYSERKTAPFSQPQATREYRTVPPEQPVGKSANAGGKYYKGAVVKHAKFGIGTIQRTEGSGDELKITVSFPGFGVKTLAVAFAKLEVI